MYNSTIQNLERMQDKIMKVSPIYKKYSTAEIVVQPPVVLRKLKEHWIKDGIKDGSYAGVRIVLSDKDLMYNQKDSNMPALYLVYRGMCTQTHTHDYITNSDFQDIVKKYYDIDGELFDRLQYFIYIVDKYYYEKYHEGAN